MISLRPYQSQGLAALWNYFQDGGKGNPVLAWPTGCHAAGTKILMYDGTLKNVEDVQVNNFIMGPDSEPRTVLSLARGFEQMYRIIPTKGEPFVVNESHILSLKATSDQNKRIVGLGKGQICNLTVRQFETSSKWFKHTNKLWRTRVDFNYNNWLPMSPYLLGVWLGDGSYITSTVNITSMDFEILEYVKNEIEWYGDNYRLYNNGSKADTLCIKSKIRGAYRSGTARILDKLGLSSKNKHIPHIYKTASYENRLAILAGLIDTDGSLIWSGGYDYISKSKQLAEDVVFISRSLGLAAYVKPCQKYDQNKKGGTYYRVSISGNVSCIPVLLKRKKAKPRLQKKDVLVTGFKIEKLGFDLYYGFALDKNHLYLTGDFTVHHNTGKSCVPAVFINYVLKEFPHQRFLMVTHVKELIEQNAEVLKYVWPTAPLGIYSAGLKSKDTAHSIVFGGIQSMVKHPSLFGHRDIIFIDEAHLVNQDETSMYLTFIATMRLLNPMLRVIGMSATPFRMGQGYITDGGLFTDIVHNLTGVDAFNMLVSEGYISPLVPLRTRTELDITNVGISKGEFIGSQLQSAVDKAEVTYAGLRECVSAGQNRKSWLLFASGIEHAEHIATMLQSFNIQCTAVHSKQTMEHNDRTIKAFRNNNLRAIVNYGKLTTGFNHPEIDLIGMFRPTMSVPLWVQMLGRGTRPAPNKSNCLVLDFARNTVRLGPINDPIIPRKKGEEVGEAPVKICEACGVYNHTKVRFCGNCGTEFEFKNKLVKTSGTEELLRSDFPQIETFPVQWATYAKRTSTKTNQIYIRVRYMCGGRSFYENVFPEGKGFARHLFNQWWQQRHPIEAPKSTEDALGYISQLRSPRQIRVWLNKKWPEIMGAEF